MPTGTPKPAFGKYLPPLFFLLLSWMAGILMPLDWHPRLFWAAQVFLWAVIAGGHFLATRWPRAVILFNIGLWTAMFMAGSFYARQRTLADRLPADFGQKPSYVVFTVNSVIRSTDQFHKYIVRVRQSGKRRTRFRALLYVPKTLPGLAPGKSYAAFLTPDQVKDLPRPHQPYAFDYGKYLRQKGIRYRLFLLETGRLSVLPGSKLLLELPFRWREKIRREFRRHLNPQNLSVASALLLGDRRWLDNRTREQFIDAGVVHILAISGMHIGILLFFLRFLFSPLRIRFRWLYHLLIFGLLWFYAWLTGFSPSVLRAVIMFGFFQWAWEAEREVSGLHILALSAFVILLADPSMWRQVGFQLSFAAVASIILFFPLFKKIYYPRNRFAAYLTDLLYVSLAAQFGVMPLVLLYFHRFSLAFLLSNFVVIPLITVVLGIGFLSLFLILTGLPAGWLLVLLNAGLSLENQIIARLARARIGVFHHVYFSPLLAAGLVIFFAGLYWWWSRPSRRRLVFLLYGMLGFHLLYATDRYLQTHRSQWALGSVQGKIALFGRQGDKLQLYTDTVPSPFIWQAYAEKARVRRHRRADFPLKFRLGRHDYVVLRNDALTPEKMPRAYGLILDRSPRVNLDKYLARIHPREIILTSNNYNYLRRRWARSFRNGHYTVIDLRRQGYLLLTE